MTNMEKKMIKIGLDILKNNPRHIITNIENNVENVQGLINEGEKLLENENIDDIDISAEELTEIMDMIKGKRS